MRITKRTDLALRILMVCAVNRGRTVTKAEIAAGCNCSENHTGQVVNALARLGYLRTIRGRGGGLRLAREDRAITVGEVMRRLEASVPLAECLDRDANSCPLSRFCQLKVEICAAMEAFYTHLDGVSLADLVAGNAELHAKLALREPPRPMESAASRRSGLA